MSIFAEVLGLTGPALLYPSWQVAFPTDNIHHPGDGPTPGVSPSMGPTGGILVGPVVSLPQCAGLENQDCHPPEQKAEPTCWNPGLSSRLIWVRHFGFNLKHRPVPHDLWFQAASISVGVAGRRRTCCYFRCYFQPGRGPWFGRGGGSVWPGRGPGYEKTAISRGFFKVVPAEGLEPPHPSG